ncbi:HPr family phosphocarrier protein [Anaerotruncus massiliensis (ex Togo et al. 2019)]|mgnify:FL=1|uniref:HPr family phosphocarrier protein n=1 Tax=Anaerotruncus TaxID=244127 RepID=UPI000C79488C|nr:HPr family phosphocarrier protein [Anaerotruncus massiliensis (ex Togo et al. 2019)]
MQQFDYTISDPMGLHARPAGQLVRQAAAFKSRVTIRRGDREADCTRLLRVMALCAAAGETVTFTVDGEDEQAACEAMRAFCTESL